MTQKNLSFIYATDVGNAKERYKQRYKSVTLSMDVLNFEEVITSVVN